MPSGGLLGSLVTGQVSYSAMYQKYFMTFHIYNLSTLKAEAGGL